MTDLRTLTIAEAAEATGFSRDKLYRLAKARQIAVVRSAGLRRLGTIRIVEASLRAWIAKHTIPAYEQEELQDPRRPVIDADLELPRVADEALFR